MGRKEEGENRTMEFCAEREGERGKEGWMEVGREGWRKKGRIDGLEGDKPNISPNLDISIYSLCSHGNCSLVPRSRVFF